MGTSEAPAPFWHGSLRRLVASLQAVIAKSPPSEASATIPVLQVLTVLAGVVGDDDLAAWAIAGLRAAHARVQPAADGATPAATPLDPLLAVAIAIATSEEPGRDQERLPALRNMAEVALARGHDDLALCAYVAAVLAHAPTNDATDARASLRDVRRQLGERAYAMLAEESGRLTAANDRAAVAKVALRAADLFALIENRKHLFAALDVAATAYCELGDASSQLACLLAIADGFLTAGVGDSTELVADETVRSLLVSVVSNGQKLVRAMAKDVDASHAALLTVDTALAHATLLLEAMRKLGLALGNDLAHLEPLLLVTGLEFTRKERRPAVLDLFEEVVRVSSAALQKQPELRQSLDGTIRALSFVVFGMAFDHAPGDPVHGLQIRRAHELASRGFEVIGDGALEALCTLAFADLLVRSRFHDEALATCEGLLARAAPDARLIRPDVLFTDTPISIHGFLHDRLAWIHFSRGAFDVALQHLERALEVCRAVTDRIGELRTLIGQSLLRRVTGNGASTEPASMALRLALELRAEEERAAYQLPLATQDLRAAESGQLSDLLQGLIATTGIATVVALRWIDDSKGPTAALVGVVHPEPPIISELLSSPAASGTPRDSADVECLAMLGRCLHELGDPIRAEQAYLAGRLAASHLDPEALARILFQHAQLYLEEHRYFSWFEAFPKHTLRWAAPGASDSRNLIVARELLVEAYSVLESGGSVLLRIAVIASAMVTFDDEPPEAETSQLWTKRAADAFRAHRDWFKSDARFVENAEDRLAVARLREALARRAKTLVDAGEKLAGRSDLSNAQRCWALAADLYEAIEDRASVGHTRARVASVWRYLDRRVKEQSMLEEAAEEVAGGTVSYEPKSSSMAVAFPVLLVDPQQGIRVAAVRFRDVTYAPELGPIAATRGKIQPAIQIALIRCYLAGGLNDEAVRAERTLLDSVDAASASGLAVRLLLGSLSSELGQPAHGLLLSSETLEIARRRVVELQPHFDGAVVLDLSKQAVSFSAGPTMAVDASWRPFDMFLGLFDLKAAVIIQLSAQYIVGDALYRTGATDDAVVNLRACAELATKHNARSLAAEAYHLLGVVEQERGDPGALHDLRKARALIRAGRVTHGTVQGPFLAVDVSASLGHYFFQTGQLRKAVHHDRQAARACESVRETLGIQELQTPLMARLSSVSERLVLASLTGAEDGRDPDVARGARAFEYSEHGKSRSLLDAVGGRGVATAKPTSLVAIEATETALRQELEGITKEIRALVHTAPRSARILALQSKRDALRSTYEDLIVERRLESARSRFVEVARPSSTEELLRGLVDISARQPREVVLLAYFVTEEATIVWLVSSRGIECDKIEIPRARLEREIAKFREGLKGRPTRLEKTDPLGKLLFGKFAKAVVGKQLGIVPHGPLHGMPFAALRYDGEYLPETTSLFSVPSANLLLRLTEKRSNRDPSLLMFADSDGSLPYAQVEAAKVGALFSEDRRRVLLRTEATRSAFAAHRDEASILHFATHGSHNRRFPIFSSLTLADGPLFLSDVTALGDEGPDLVVLSACHTGANQLTAGDELIGLSGAFLRAGATTVVVNMWEAEDATMAVAMERFYDAIVRRGRSRGEALHETTRSLIKEGFGPRSWAGLVLIGNPGN